MKLYVRERIERAQELTSGEHPLIYATGMVLTGQPVSMTIYLS
jgi:hypothetical protein